MTYCKKCGIQMSSNTIGDDICWECKNKQGSTDQNKGWICPACGKSLSPNIISCPFCKPLTETGNAGTFQGKTILLE